MKKVYSLIGLSKRAGKAISGEKNVKLSIADGSAALVILADDISENTFKSITNSCKYYNVDFFTFGNMIDLGHCVGNDFNAAVAILDNGLAQLVKNSLKNNDGGVA